MNAMKWIFSTIGAIMATLLVVLFLYTCEVRDLERFNAEILGEFKDFNYIPDEEEDDFDMETDMEQESGRESISGNYDKFIFVGDSRCKGMEFMAQDNDVFIAENGRGYDFLLEQMSSIIYQCDENTAVIIGLGVNDNLDSGADNYLEILGKLKDDIDGQVYYMLINPVDEEKESYNGYNVKNERIDNFNNKIVNEMDSGIGVIDTNSYLKKIGFETLDGLHYSDETYSDIYNFIKADIIES